MFMAIFTKVIPLFFTFTTLIHTPGFLQLWVEKLIAGTEMPLAYFVIEVLTPVQTIGILVHTRTFYLKRQTKVGSEFLCKISHV